MSWLSEALGIEDDNVRRRRLAEQQAAAAAAQQAAQQKAAQEAALRQQEATQAAADTQSWNDKNSAAAQTGTQSAYDYFTNRGVGLGDYKDDIDAAIAAASRGIPTGAENPDSYYSSVGENTYNSLTDALRARSLATVNQNAPTGFASNMIGDTSDDAIIQAILDEQGGKATGYLDNLKSRNVITSAGYQGGQADLEAQKTKGLDTLNQLGTSILGGGRATLEGIGDEARFGAGNASLASGFDWNPYQGRIDTAFNDFMAGLEGSYKGQAGNLFDTTGLLSAAGTTQGPQNTKFNPNAMGGFYGEEDEEEDRSAAGSSVF